MQIFSRGELVGTLSDVMFDMWYVEGTFSPADTPASTRFVAAAARLNVRATMADPTKAIRALLQEAPSDNGTTLVVMSLSEGRLFGRRVLLRPAVEWTEANVPE